MSEVETTELEVDQEVEQEIQVQPNYVDNFVTNVIDGNNSVAKEDFENSLSLKVTQAMDDYKQKIASEIFNQGSDNGQPQQDDQGSS